MRPAVTAAETAGTASSCSAARTCKVAVRWPTFDVRPRHASKDRSPSPSHAPDARSATRTAARAAPNPSIARSMAASTARRSVAGHHAASAVLAASRVIAAQITAPSSTARVACAAARASSSTDGGKTDGTAGVVQAGCDDVAGSAAVAVMASPLRLTRSRRFASHRRASQQ